MEPSKSFYRSFVGIGVELAGVRPNRKADIERTLLEATRFADSEDRRILGLLASWIVTHGDLACIGKLRRLNEQEKLGDPQVLSALAFLALSDGFHEWKPLCHEYPERFLWGESSKLALTRTHKFSPFAKAGLVIPEKFIRIRREDILSREDLARHHLQVRLRLVFGANLRADAVFYLLQGVTTASELMRAIGCSYEPAHRMLADFQAAGGIQVPSLRM